MTKKEIKEYSGRTKDYLLALTDYPCFTQQLPLENKPYAKLANWLLENEMNLRGENRRIPTAAEIAKQCNTEASKTTQQIRMIYQDIVELNWNEPRKFIKKDQKMCCLRFNYLNRYASFYIGLKEIPRVGESFEFWFVLPKTGGRYFYVKNIGHEIKNDEQLITISLTAEQPYLYLQLLKEKAYLNRQISLEEYLFDNYLLEEKLIQMFEHRPEFPVIGNRRKFSGSFT